MVGILKDQKIKLKKFEEMDKRQRVRVCIIILNREEGEKKKEGLNNIVQWPYTSSRRILSGGTSRMMVEHFETAAFNKKSGGAVSISIFLWISFHIIYGAVVFYFLCAKKTKTKKKPWKNL